MLGLQALSVIAAWADFKVDLGWSEGAHLNPKSTRAIKPAGDVHRALCP
jgi:hypothetical protein